MRKNILSVAILLSSTILATTASADFSLTVDDFISSPRIQWQETGQPGADTIEVLLAGQPRYFKYAYVRPDGRLVYDSQQTGLSGVVDADFINIEATTSGAAIFNNTDIVIEKISGDFINNSTTTTTGGNLSNRGTIKEIIGDFVANHISHPDGNGNAYGGGIYNAAGTIGNVMGNFIGNWLEGKAACGGGIYSSGTTIDHIQGNFIGNRLMQVTADGGYAKGGAIDLYNTDVKSISGNFIGNGITAIEAGYGSAINIASSNVNGVKIGNISGVFAYNYTKVSEGKGGGALYFYDNGPDEEGVVSEMHIDSVSGDFIGNTVEAPKNVAQSGVLHVQKVVIDKLEGNFKENSVTGNTAVGAVIIVDTVTSQTNVTDAAIGSIQGNFEGNYAIGTNYALGGAFYNRGKTGAITNSSFIGNFVQSAESYAQGGAIYNYDNSKYNVAISAIDNVIFENNHARGIINGRGGAIYNVGLINSITNSIFRNNYVAGDSGQSSGGAVYNGNGANIGNIQNVQFIGNEVKSSAYNALGGALVSGGGIEKLENVLFENNGVTVEEEHARGGAWFNPGTVGSVSTVNFSGNYAKGGTYARGGAIYNQGTLPALVNSSFIGNYVEASDSGEEKSAGGAIYSTTDLTISALNGDSLFSGNYVKAGGVERGNDIYLAGTGDSPLNLNLTADNGSLSLNSGIDGNGYSIALSGDASGTINFGGLISNASEVVSSDVTVNFNKGQEGLVYNQQSGTANLNAAFNNSSLTVGETVTGISSKTAATTVMNVADGSYLNGNNSLIVNSGTVNIGNLDNNLHFNKLSMNGGSLAIENVGVDLATQVMGSLSADSYDHQGGTIAVKNVNVTADGSAGTTAVNFTDSLIADKVVSGIKESLGPVWKYDVAYNSQTGEFEFTRTREVNPEVMVSGVAAAATVGILNDEIYSRVLGDVDSFGSSTPHVSSSDRSIKNAWVKTFGSKDSVDLKNFRGADTKFYGFIGGLSSDRINEGQGWSAIYSVYGAYAGGEQKFAGEKVTNNGGYLGLGANFYNGDFFIGTTVNGGLIRNRSDKTGIDGKDKFNSYVGGVAAKSGYDYHIGSFTVEPNVYASYTVIGADDYMTKSGVKVDFGTMSVIEAAPGLKLAQEFGEGLKGYVSGRYVWTFTEGDHVKANQFDLPDVELEDYAEYGIGLEKNWDASSGFVEVKRRDGGRNGWNFTAGYKSAF